MLQEALKLDALPERIECFDISHALGEATVAACVAISPDGPLKSDYRRFNIEGVPAGDDYGAMTQALLRRYRRAVEQGADDGAKLPDLVLIDGGKGQLAAAAAAEELQVRYAVGGGGRGRERKPGEEQVFIAGSKTALRLPNDSPALHLIQQTATKRTAAIAGHASGARRAANRRSNKSPASVMPPSGAVEKSRRLAEVARRRRLTRAGHQSELAQRIYRLSSEG